MYDDGVFSLRHERKIKELSDRLAARDWALTEAERRCTQWKWTAHIMFGCAVIILLAAAFAQAGVAK